MPTLGDFTAIKAALAAATVSAWGVKKCHFGFVQLPQRPEDMPYACWELHPVAQEWHTTGSALQGWEWTVAGVFPLTDALEKALDLKVAKAGQLALLLEADELFAGVGMLPLVSSFDPGEPLGNIEGAYTVTVGFSFKVDRAWGT